MACKQCFAQVAGQSGARRRRRAGRAVARQGVHACRRAQVASWLAGQAGVCARTRAGRAAHARKACSARAQGVQRTRAGRLARCCRPLSSCPRCLTARAPRPARQPGASPRVEAGQGAAPGLSHERVARSLRSVRAGGLGLCARDPLLRPRVVAAISGPRAHLIRILCVASGSCLEQKQSSKAQHSLEGRGNRTHQHTVRIRIKDSKVSE